MKLGWIATAIIASASLVNVGAGQAGAGNPVPGAGYPRRSQASAIPQADKGSDLCEAKIRVRVAALQDPTSFLPAGSTNVRLTQYWSTPDHVDSFCFHGGYCYPAHVKQGGKMVDVMTPRKCRIDMSTGQPDSDGVLHDLILIRSQVSASALKRNDLTALLENKGMCNACASGAADAYIHSPRSSCGRFVQRLIDGDPEAVRKASNASECS